MKSIQELRIWIADNLSRELSMQSLAERVAMSVRNFERVFTREVGSAPSRYVAQLRVEAARSQLAQTEKSIDQIAVIFFLMRRQPPRPTLFPYTAPRPARHKPPP